MSGIFSSMFELSKMSNCVSRSISAENFTGEKGKGGMATSGTGLSEDGQSGPAKGLGQGWKVSPSIVLQPGEIFDLAKIEGPGVIKHIWITDSCDFNRKLVLRMYWDDSDTPSVETPLGDFFASAEYQDFQQINSLPVCVNPKRGFNCYWDMPFYKNAKITVENLFHKPVTVYYQIDYVLTKLAEGYGYFHAQFRRTNPLKYKDDYVILDNVQGNGHYVGTYMFWGVNNNWWWGEGEIKFYLDGDKEFPTICGTGTEDYFCGSYNFTVDDHYNTYTTAYTGLSKVTKTDKLNYVNQRFSMYRLHI